MKNKSNRNNWYNNNVKWSNRTSWGIVRISIINNNIVRSYPQCKYKISLNWISNILNSTKCHLSNSNNSSRHTKLNLVWTITLLRGVWGATIATLFMINVIKVYQYHNNKCKCKCKWLEMFNQEHCQIYLIN